MNQPKTDKLKNFFNFLYEDKESDTTEMQKDLEASGINLQRIKSAVDDLLHNAKQHNKLSWLTEAPKKRTAINEFWEKQVQRLRAKFKDIRELSQAIRNGEFGVPLQEKANAFFRNQNFSEISDADLVSFFEDCQLLDALSKDQEGKE